eukprot:TRINITY_DN368_c1_g1_i18.p1 TRINITY_DN368_c1_g1~~TRINITY_DN368_c1_g1_i18.p1  ORF type:complete len:139 (+),score=26.29 TRINITY_DN368_c1_g1_i18:721-1137(+)
MPSPRASIEEKENRESSLVRGHSTTTTLLTSTFPDPPPQPTMMAHILSDIDVEGPGSDTESPRQRQRRPQVKKNKKKKSTKGKQEKARKASFSCTSILELSAFSPITKCTPGNSNRVANLQSTSLDFTSGVFCLSVSP